MIPLTMLLKTWTSIFKKQWIVINCLLYSYSHTDWHLLNYSYESAMFCLPIDCGDEKNKLPNEHDLIYDELKTIILDHQAVMK